MKKQLLALALLLISSAATAADNGLIVTNGAGTLLRSKDVGVGVQAPSAILVDQTGAFVGAFTNYGTTPGAVPVPGMNVFMTNTPPVSQSGVWTVNQGGTWNIGTVTAVTSITNPVAATQSGAWTVNPTTAASWGVGATAGAVPANAIYNAMNVAGNLVGLTGTGTSLNVNCTAGCAGSGGTSSNFGSAFPTVGTAIGLTSGTNMVAWSATTTYGTAPAAIAVPAVNAFVTNAATAGRTANGTTGAGASPVVQPSAPLTYHLATNTAGTNALAPKGSAAVLFSCQLGNNTTTAGFFKIYNKATSPTVGTDVPVVTLIMPGPAAGGGGSNVNFGPGGLALATGFAVATTGGLLDTDSSNAPAGITANCQYE